MTGLHMEYAIGILDLPRPCIEECSTGRVDRAVQYWRVTLGFTVRRDGAIACLRRYGAWSPSQLAAMPDYELAEKVLWVACCNFRDYIGEAEELKYDPYDPPEDFNSRFGSDMFTLE